MARCESCGSAANVLTGESADLGRRHADLLCAVDELLSMDAECDPEFWRPSIERGLQHLRTARGRIPDPKEPHGPDPTPPDPEGLLREGEAASVVGDVFRRHALTPEDLAKVERLRVPLPEVKWRRATPEEAACAPTGDLDDVFRERDSLKAEVERLRALLKHARVVVGFASGYLVDETALLADIDAALKGAADGQ